MASENADLRYSAMGLLARREHSRRELFDKLQRRAESQQQLEMLLDQLQEQGLQSDDRFAESFLRGRFNRGQGVNRIQQDLRQKEVAAEIISRVLDECGVDWFKAAQDCREKRFGLEAPADRKEHARQVRFLLYRGFNYDQVQEALNARPDELD